MQVDTDATGVFEVCPVLTHYIGAHVLFSGSQGAAQGRRLFVLGSQAGSAGDRRAGFVFAVVDGALVLLLGMAIGRWAPLRSVLHPALRSVHWEAAFPSAFVRGAVGIEKVLAITSESKRGKKALEMEPH